MSSSASCCAISAWRSAALLSAAALPLSALPAWSTRLTAVDQRMLSDDCRLKNALLLLVRLMPLVSLALLRALVERVSSRLNCRRREPPQR